MMQRLKTTESLAPKLTYALYMNPIVEIFRRRLTTKAKEFHEESIPLIFFFFFFFFFCKREQILGARIR